MTQCITTKESALGQAAFVRFKCPNCQKYEIVRSRHARKIAARYTCPECGFEGPN